MNQISDLSQDWLKDIGMIVDPGLPRDKVSLGAKCVKERNTIFPE
jgi:hypothetical protein